jgi:hypothetical protein
MNSNRTLDSSKRFGRRGIQALYTYTPFKFLRAQRGEKYTLILAETAHHQVANRQLRWRSESVKDKFLFNTPQGFQKIIVQPYDIYPIDFTKERSERYVFISRQHRWSYFPEYMEFSWEALREGYYCAFGWVLLSTKNENCPIVRDCPLRSETRCKYYFGPIAYSSLYNVYPLIRKKYELPPDKGENEPLAAIRYKSMPLATLTYVPNGSYIAFIDGVQFLPKRARMFRQPTLYLKEGIGFRIPQAPAILFEFNKDTLRELIRDRLNNSRTLARWIKMKQRLYLDANDDVNLVKEGNGFDAFQRLYEVVAFVLLGKSSSSEQARSIVRAVNEARVDDNLADFAGVLFVHSFTHLFINWINARYGYGKGDFGYYLEHDRIQPIGLQKDGVRAFVFEMVVGGLGYLKNFEHELKNKGETILADLFFDFQKVLGYCEEKSKQAMNNLPTVLNSFRDNDQTVNSLIDTILAAYIRSFNEPDVYPHVNSIRQAIVDAIDMTSETRSLMDDLLDKAPHCWDGCQLCVMLEQGCNYPPFDQPFLVSNRLTGDIIGVLKHMVDRPLEAFPLKVGIYEEFLRFVSAARYTIDLISPWLTPEIVKVLAEKAEENELIVRIITSNDITNKTHKDSLRLIRDIKNRIKTKIAQQLHAKGMLVDDVMLLTGSFNFTISGLTSNVENLMVDFSLKGPQHFKEKFETLWAESQPLD